MRTLAATAVVACVVVVLAPSAAYADGAGGANNVVVVTNTVDNAAAARDRVQVAYDAADTVANQNIATATSTNCTGCRTVAVAMQVLVVEGSPSTFIPANAAVASNGGCESCQTYAYAFQYVIQVPGSAHLSAAAEQDLMALRTEVDQATASTLSYLDLKAELEGLFAHVVQTVDDGLQAAGPTTATARESVQLA